jgi:hypothetical protein
MHGNTVLLFDRYARPYFRWPFHEYPIDCWRAYPDGMTALYEEGGTVTIGKKLCSHVA